MGVNNAQDKQGSLVQKYEELPCFYEYNIKTGDDKTNRSGQM